MVEDNETEDELASDFLVATPADPAANSYCTVLRMYELMKGVSSKLSDDWNKLETEEQARLCIEGSRLIDQFRNWGVPLVKTQGLSFPRAGECPVSAPVIPKGIERALLEYVKYRVDGDMVGIKQLQKEGVTQSAVLSQSSTIMHDPTELPAGTKRELLKIARATWTHPKSARCNNLQNGSELDQQQASDGSLFG